MARRKVRLADNIARFIFIEDDATQGATLGVNLYDSNGNVLTVEGLRALLDLETSTTVVNTAPGGTTDHGTLAGLADNDHPQYSLTAHNHDHGALTGLGDDDHPQYGALAQNEAVAGSWSFTYGDTDFSGADHASLWLGDLGAALNEKWFGVSSTAGEFHVGTTADVGGSEKDIFRATRIGTAIDSVAYGNSTDLPIHQFWGEVALQTDGWISLDEHASAPATPATGRVAVYAKADGKVYRKDDTGTETELGGGGAGADYLDDLLDVNAPTPTDGQVLTWDDYYSEWVADTNPAGVTDHGALTGLADDDHPQYGQLATAETVSGKWDFTYDPVSGYGSQFSGYAQFANGFECKDYIEFVADAGGTDYLSWYWGNYDGAADEKWWILESDASKKEWAIRSCNDTFSGASYRDHLKLHRNGQVVDAITLGDTADDPSITLNTAALSGATGGYEFLSVDSDGATGVSGTYIELNSDVHSEFLLKSFVNDTYGPTMTFYHSRGTKASPTQSLSGDSTGGFFFGARHNSGDYQYPAGVEFTLSGNSDSVTGAPGALIFKTGLTALALVPRISIKTDGEVALGTDGWITFDEHTSAPATPASGRVALYAKADGKVYCKDDAGTETDLTAGGAGGSVATDTIWDAKGDLAVGTGANTASKLTVGADYLTLVSDAAEATGAKWGSIGIPQNAQTGNYTIALTDNGKHIFHASGDGAGDVYTIPANASVALPVGFAVTFINMATDTVSIAITTDTMYFSPTGATGSRTLSQYGIATAVKVTSTTWVISGSGLA